jgi:hypothetical protein
MWLLFDGADLVAYSKHSKGAPVEAMVVDLPTHTTEGLWRACQAGRVSYQGGIRMDGQPWAPPPGEVLPSYPELRSAIIALPPAYPAVFRQTLLQLADLLLEHERVEL